MALSEKFGQTIQIRFRSFEPLVPTPDWEVGYTYHETLLRWIQEYNKHEFAHETTIELREFLYYAGNPRGYWYIGRT